ncbi:hypothetical protein Sango_0445400 [Sesamum angolense]|uniref:Uncharacterized protein n=1 Tax=Sesamum angolense TaxID=2727404 RepID=A0AAE1XC46_9LAMI|nr:hypothetical protein Sango_0445400 [Sesamum angolense]
MLEGGDFAKSQFQLAEQEEDGDGNALNASKKVVNTPSALSLMCLKLEAVGGKPGALFYAILHVYFGTYSLDGIALPAAADYINCMVGTLNVAFYGKL